MVDTHRLQTTSAGMLLVVELAARLAERAGGVTTILEVSTYLPMDVESVARVMEGVETLDEVEVVKVEGLESVKVANGERFRRELGEALLDGVKLDEIPELARSVGALKRNERWLKTVRGQHELLHLVAESGQRIVDLSYLEGRAQVPRARIQGLLNDFDAAGYIEVEYDEDVGELSYRFPELDYGEKRFRQNMEQIDTAEPPVRSRRSVWGILAIVAAVVLVIIIVLRW